MEEEKKCPWCGHESCAKCKQDRWPVLRMVVVSVEDAL